MSQIKQGGVMRKLVLVLCLLFCCNFCYADSLNRDTVKGLIFQNLDIVVDYILTKDDFINYINLVKTQEQLAKSQQELDKVKKDLESLKKNDGAGKGTTEKSE